MDADSRSFALPEKLWKTLFSLKNETSGTQCVREIAQTLSLPTQHAISCPVGVATDTRITKRGNQVSLRKILDVQKSCVYAVKLSSAKTENVSSTHLAAKF